MWTFEDRNFLCAFIHTTVFKLGRFVLVLMTSRENLNYYAVRKSI